MVGKIPLVEPEDMLPLGYSEPLAEQKEQRIGIFEKLGITKPKKLGDCKCIPKKDKEDLNFAIRRGNFEMAKHMAFAGIDVAGGLYLRRTVDLNDLQKRIDNTPTCEDGDILKECTCISNSNRESMNLAISMSSRRMKDARIRETVHRLNLMKEKIKKIPRCKKLGLF